MVTRIQPASYARRCFVSLPAPFLTAYAISATALLTTATTVKRKSHPGTPWFSVNGSYSTSIARATIALNTPSAKKPMRSICRRLVSMYHVTSLLFPKTPNNTGEVEIFVWATVPCVWPKLASLVPYRYGPKRQAMESANCRAYVAAAPSGERESYARYARRNTSTPALTQVVRSRGLIFELATMLGRADTS